MEYVRDAGKFVTFAACLMAVAHGIIYQKFFAPIGLSAACILGLILWIIGAVGVRILKARAERAKGARLPRAS